MFYLFVSVCVFFVRDTYVLLCAQCLLCAKKVQEKIHTNPFVILSFVSIHHLVLVSIKTGERKSSNVTSAHWISFYFESLICKKLHLCVIRHAYLDEFSVFIVFFLFVFGFTMTMSSFGHPDHITTNQINHKCLSNSPL